MNDIWKSHYREEQPSNRQKFDTTVTDLVISASLSVPETNWVITAYREGMSQIDRDFSIGVLLVKPSGIGYKRSKSISPPGC